MARPARRVTALLLLLAIGAISVSVLAVAGVFSSSRSEANNPQVVPVPDVSGMTAAKAVEALRAAHLRPAIRFTRHVKGHPGGIIVAAPLGNHPISVGSGHSVGVATEGDVTLIVSR